MGSPRPKVLTQRIAELLLDGALQVFVRTVDTVRFVRKLRRRYQARRKR